MNSQVDYRQFNIRNLLNEINSFSENIYTIKHNTKMTAVVVLQK